MEIQKDEIFTLFRKLLRLLGKDELQNCKGYYLENTGEIGGYIVVEQIEYGGKNYPFGHQKRTLREMYLSLELAIQVAEMIKAKTKAAETLRYGDF